MTLENHLDGGFLYWGDVGRSVMMRWRRVRRMVAREGVMVMKRGKDTVAIGSGRL